MKIDEIYDYDDTDDLIEESKQLAKTTPNMSYEEWSATLPILEGKEAEISRKETERLMEGIHIFPDYKVDK